jgi:hypothetical protein
VQCADMQTLSVRAGTDRSQDWSVGQMRTGIAIVRHVLR